MNRILLIPFFLTLLFFSCNPKEKSDLWIAQTPAGDRYCEINETGKSIIPNGRYVAPYGKTLRTAPHPYGLVLSPDGKIAVTANSGTAPFSITIIYEPFSDNPRVKQIPEGAQNDEGILESVFMGLAITPDNRFVYVAGGEANKIFKFDLQSGAKVDSINCAVKAGERDYMHGYIGDMVLTKDGKTLYAVDQIGFRLMIIDTDSKNIRYNIQTGRYPFGVTLSPDEKKVFVANVGMYAYSPQRNLDPARIKETAADFPTSGFNTKESKDGFKTDKLDVPGLGDPNAPETFSVWSVDVSGEPKVSKKIKTGFLVGAEIEGIPAVGGSSPNSLVASDKYIFVSNGNNDCVSVISLEKDTVIKNIMLQPDSRLNRFRGVIPFGIALSPDKKTLFVAESGINAVAIIDAETFEIKGHVPTGWFPSKLAVSPDGKKVMVASAKGFGSGPNGGSTFKGSTDEGYVGNLMYGTVSTWDIPSDFKQTTQQVLDNNFKFTKVNDAAHNSRKDNPIPLFGKQKESPIKYIVFISKENRTYDEVFGQVKDGKGEGEMARYGVNRAFANNAKTDSLSGITVMPNHLALAQRFAISDNFYVDSDHSADGHRWLANTYPNEWMETSVTASYGGKRNMRRDSKAPGNGALYGASGAVYPEDYNEAGSMWDHLARNKTSFHNFGFGVELAGAYEDSTLKYGGVKILMNHPISLPLYENSSRLFPTYNMAIPDQFRVDMFKKEFNEQWMGEGKTMPQIITIMIPNDHGAGDRPNAGYPFRESYMSDNDLAVGRMIEFLSSTPYWKNMAIVITEDDSQDGRDHIDAHRSLLMVISPYSKKNYVGHQHYSFGSIFKTFWNIFGMPYLNQYDAAATDLADLFTNEPDFTPYKAYPVDPRVFDPAKALTPFDEKFDWKAVSDSPQLDNVADFLKKK